LHVKDLRHTILGELDSAYDPPHHEEVSPLEEIIEAYRAIDAAWTNYRAVLRKHLAAKNVQQVDVVGALGRTREMIRRDAMTDEQREEMRQVDAKRKRTVRSNKST
jgi:hypothetical protein